MRRSRRSILAEPAQPPPSPIPTGKGSRSAANEPFARFLDRSLRVPALSLPGASSPTRHAAPAKADLRSLLSSADGGCLDRALRSARDFGVFRVTGHGVSAEELGLVIGEEREGWSGGVSGGGLGESICWLIGSESASGSESGRRDIGDVEYRRPSEKMKIVASKLEAIAEQLGRIMLENVRKKSNYRRVFAGNKESVLSLYRFHHKNSIERNQVPLNDDIEIELHDQICLSLHIPFEHCQIYVQSEEDHFSFDADPETLVVTIGKQIEEWSDREFKCVHGKMIFVPAPNIRATRDYSFSVELKFSSSNLSNFLERNRKSIISIGDQIIFAILIILIYQTYIYLTSYICGA